MDIRFNVGRDDILIFLDHVKARALKARPRPARFAMALLAGAIAAFALGALSHVLLDARAVVLLAMCVLCYSALVAVGLRTGQYRAGRTLDQWAGTYGLSLTPSGFSVHGGHFQRFVPWPEIAALEETKCHFYLYLRADSGLIVPKAALGGYFGEQGFAARVRGYWNAHPDNRGMLPARPSSTAWFLRVLVDARANLRAGCGLAALRKVGAQDFRSGWTNLIFLLLLGFALSGAADWFAMSPEPRFDSLGFSAWLAGLLLFLASGLAMGGLTANTGGVLPLLVMIAAGRCTVAAVDLLVQAGLSAVPGELSAQAYSALDLIPVAWGFPIVFRAIVLQFRQPVSVALVLVAMFALLNVAMAYVLPAPVLFHSSPEEATERAVATGMDAEDVLYRQPRLLAKAAERLAPERPGVVDLYFVGFAGEAREPVFAHEIEYARDLLARDFDTRERSLVLVNSPETVASLPIASTHNLEAALDAVARRMNPEEDLLFLYLTSHGSRDHELAVEFGTLPLNGLSASRLKELLDHAGIRNRILVVSACYSGGFLDVLRDARSLIVTAASRDRPSFGCGVESEFTYFGEAYFVHALNETRSFIDAFDRARMLIGQWERNEGVRPSLPQVYVGRAIVPRLQQFETQLETPSQ